MNRQEKLEYQAMCVKILKSIMDTPYMDMKSPRVAAGIIGPFLMTLIPDANQRHHKLRNLFRSKIAEGDDILLRLIKDIVSSMPKVAEKTVLPYKQEYNEMMANRKTKKVKQTINK